MNHSRREWDTTILSHIVKWAHVSTRVVYLQSLCILCIWWVYGAQKHTQTYEQNSINFHINDGWDVMRPNVTFVHSSTYVRIYISRSPAIEHSRWCCCCCIHSSFCFVYVCFSFLFPNKLSHIYACIKMFEWKTIDSFLPRSIRLKQKKKKLIRIFICVYLKLKADYRWWKSRVSVFICSINSLADTL